MRVLLDECLPEELCESIIGHEATTVAKEGWKGLKNGELLTKATSNGFSVFLTADKNLPYQQNPKKYDIAIVVLDVVENRLPFLAVKIPSLLELLPTIEPNKIYIC